MRAVVVIAIVLAGCTIGAAPTPVVAPAAPDPDQMSSATLDHQDPAGPDDPTSLDGGGCNSWPFGGHDESAASRGGGGATSIGCGGGHAGGFRHGGRRGDTSGLLIALAIGATTRRRRRRLSSFRVRRIISA